MGQRLLHNRDYRLLWGLLVASGIALWLRILGTAQALLDSEGDPWRVGLIGAIQLVVQIPALLWGGTLADRVNRKTLMFAANSLSAAAMGLLGLLGTKGTIPSELIYLAIALTAATQMFANSPIYFSTNPNLCTCHCLGLTACQVCYRCRRGDRSCTEK